MPRLPTRLATVVLSFAPLFSARCRRRAEAPLIGAILTPGKRTVGSILRTGGLARERRFVNHHRVPDRAVWSARAASDLLPSLLVEAFAPDGPVVPGVDDTIERRRGRRIGAKGIYRDPVRSSHGHFVEASGLRRLSLMLLAPVPRAGCVRALPFLTAPAPSERSCRARGRRHKELTDWARQMVLQARRRLPGRDLVLVADSGFAASGLLAALSRRRVACVTRLRSDAALHEPAPPRLPGTDGRPRTKGARLPTLADVLADPRTRWRRETVPGWYGGDADRVHARVVELCSSTAVWRHGGLPVVPIRRVPVRDPLGRFGPQALPCTDPAREPGQILRWLVRRWRIEVTLQETRAHLGVETRRQWSGLAIARTTPCLLGLFSLVTLLAARLSPGARLAVTAAAWYRKPRPTFSDTLAAVRRQFRCERGLLLSRHAGETTKLRPALREGLAYALCHAA